MKVKQKEEIIKYVLENNGHSREPDIREHLKQKHGIKDISNIKRHLKDLYKQKCINKIESPGRANEWDITTKNHLKNTHDNYPEIDLKKYKKPIDIINFSLFKPEKGGLIDEYTYQQFIFALKESESLFLALVDSDWHTLYNRWENMFSVGDAQGISFDAYPIQIIKHAIEHYAQHDIAVGCESQKLIDKIKEDK